MGVLEVVPPIQESGVCPAFFSRAVWPDVPSASYPLVHAPFVLPHVSSLHLTPALGARYLLLQVCSFSGHPAGLGLAGWLAGSSFDSPHRRGSPVLPPFFLFFVDSNLISGPPVPYWWLPPLPGASRTTTSGS